MATAQRMVDEAARAAGYSNRLFTGQPRGLPEIPVTTRSELPFSYAFLTNDREVAAHYSGAMARAGRNTDFGTGRVGRTYRTFVKVAKPLNLGSGINEKQWIKMLSETQDIDSEIHDILYQKDEDELLERYPISEEDAQDNRLWFRLKAIAAEIQRLGDPDGLLKNVEIAAAMKGIGFERNDDLGAFVNIDGTRADSITEAIEGAWSDLSGQGYYLQDALDNSPLGKALIVSPKEVSEKVIKEGGYDGYRFSDTEMGGTTWVVFDASQIKSADHVTRDEAGNVIPLSRRFNPASDDIRY